MSASQSAKCICRTGIAQSCSKIPTVCMNTQQRTFIFGSILARRKFGGIWGGYGGSKSLMDWHPGNGGVFFGTGQHL